MPICGGRRVCKFSWCGVNKCLDQSVLINEAEQVIRKISILIISSNINLGRKRRRGLILSSFLIANEGDIQNGDLICRVILIFLNKCFRSSVLIKSSSKRFPINGDGERFFNGIELSCGL